jgi:hypothetical protein
MAISNGRSIRCYLTIRVTHLNLTNFRRCCRASHYRCRPARNFRCSPIRLIAKNRWMIHDPPKAAAMSEKAAHRTVHGLKMKMPTRCRRVEAADETRCRRNFRCRAEELRPCLS